MNRLKLLAAATLLAVPLINACGEDLQPTPVGTISGQVVIEGEQQAGVTAKLNTGETATTTSTGSFTFENIVAGSYDVTISGFAEDGSFDKTKQSATIATDGQKVTVNFNGSWIRTSAIVGEVTVEGTGLEGVTVKLTGMSEGEMVTSATGAYSFTGLRAGVHTVEISGFDDEDIGFSATTSVADVEIGATAELHFQASYLRASAVMGQVTVEGEALAGVTVSLQGVDRDLNVGTNSGGQFSFTELRKGDYAVAISGYDPDKYGFEVTSQTITVAYGETAPVDFDGIDLRTATVSGVVTIEGTGLEGVTVSLTGEGAQLSMVTDAAGQWTFAELHAGSYSIGISGYDMDEYGFDKTSASVTVALKETATADFDGIMLRTAAISGHVSIGGSERPPSPSRSRSSTIAASGRSYSARVMTASPSVSSIWKTRTVTGCVVSCQSPANSPRSRLPSPSASCAAWRSSRSVSISALSEPAVTVGVDGVEHLHRRDGELPLVEEAHAVAAVTRVTCARQHRAAEGGDKCDGGQCLRLHRFSFPGWPTGYRWVSATWMRDVAEPCRRRDESVASGGVTAS